MLLLMALPQRAESVKLKLQGLGLEKLSLLDCTRKIFHSDSFVKFLNRFQQIYAVVGIQSKQCHFYGVVSTYLKDPEISEHISHQGLMQTRRARCCTVPLDTKHPLTCI